METLLNHPIHGAASLFPMMSADELQELANDIQKNGLLQPITTYKGQVIDGRNRLVACEIANVLPDFREWTGAGSVTEWVLSVNLKRRHLTPSQKAAIAANSLPMLEEEAHERKKSTLRKGQQIPDTAILPEREAGEARERAAEITGASPRYVSDAKKIKEESPEKFAEVLAGIKTIPQAKRELNGEEVATGESDALRNLKAAWKKAEAGEREEFLTWAGI